MIHADIIDRARSERIEGLLAERGIKLRGRSGSLEGPCPICGGDDRFAVSLKKQVFNCRGCGARGGDAIALLRFLDDLSFREAVERLAGGQNESTGYIGRAEPKKAASELPGDDESRRKADMATWLWGRREPISENNAAGLYLRKRGFVDAFPVTLGYLPPNGKHPPAMIAAFGFCDEPEPGLITPPSFITGVHLTRLTMEGGKAPIEQVKITLGPSVGLPIVLAPANDLLAIDIAEGIEKGLLIQADTGAGMWVAGCAGRMPAVAAVLPAYVECATIWPDCDETGFRFAREAARIIQGRKIEVRIKGTHHK